MPWISCHTGFGVVIGKRCSGAADSTGSTSSFAVFGSLSLQVCKFIYIYIYIHIYICIYLLDRGLTIPDCSGL